MNLAGIKREDNDQTIHQISGTSLGLLLCFAFAAMTIALGLIEDRWLGMTVAMGLLLPASAAQTAACSRLKLSFPHVVGGIAAGVLHFGLTLGCAALLFNVRPEWQAYARTLYSWRAGHSPLFMAVTLPMIVLSEELLWRGVLTGFLTERCGKFIGIGLAALIYAAAHFAAFNPVLLIAAVGCGVWWGLLYSATDDIVTPFASHLLWDALLLFVFPVVR